MNNVNGNIDNSVSANATASIQSADQNSVSAISTNTPSIERDPDDPSIIHAVPPSIHLDELPAGVLSKIFNFVPIVEWPKLELTNHRIRDGTYDAWRNLKIFDTQKSVLPVQRGNVYPNSPYAYVQLFQKLILRAPNLTEISGFPSQRMSVIDLILQSLSSFDRLKNIQFGDHSFTELQLAHFFVISSSRKTLINLDATNSIYLFRRHDAPAFTTMQDGFEVACGTMLRPVTISFAENDIKLSFDFLPSIDTSRLTSFNVRGSIVPQKFLADFLARSPKLERVGFDICNYYESTEATHSLDRQSQVVMLETNKYILASVGRMEKLKSLEMSMLFKCNGGCDCKRFEKEFELLFKALSKRPSFAELTIADQLGHTPFLQSIAPVLGQLKKFKFLIDQLNLTAMGRILRSQRVLDTLYVFSDSAAINDMTGSSATLRTLSVVFRDKAPSRRELLELTKFKELRELRLHCVGQHIDDDVMKSWADAFGSNLTKFEMDDYQHVSIACIVQFVQKCPKLQFFVISKSSIDDEGLRRVAALKPKIKVLALQGCDRVSTKGAQAVVDGFESLQCFHFYQPKSEWRDWVSTMKTGESRVINFHSEYNTYDHWK